MIQNWRAELGDPRFSESRIVSSIFPIFDLWINRTHGNLNYYLTQVITGHGNFRNYLFKIKKSDNPDCLFCTNVIEDAQHVVETCPEWEVHRIDIRTIFDNDLSISNILRCMCGDGDRWRAFSDYVTRVLKIKDERERVILQRLRQ